MKGFALLVVVLAGLMTSPARAQEDFGVGVILAEPTGLSAKMWFDKVHAVDAAAAWSFSGPNSLQIHVDYLIHRYGLFNIDRTYGEMPIYFGIGARFKAGDDDRGRDDDDKAGVRVPLGVTYVFARAPFDVFAEIVPVLDLAPDTDLDLNAAIGGRFYFER